MPSERSLLGIVEASRPLILRRHNDASSVRLWIFLTDSAWQDDTRLSDYWRLWKRLAKNGMGWPESQRSPEFTVHSPHCVRFAATALVSDTTLGEAMEIMFRSGCTAFMLISGDDLLCDSGVAGLFDNAFSTSTEGRPETDPNWGRLIQSRLTRNDVIVKRSGLFEELMWSIDLFAQPATLKSLMR
jgi:hypothetical protein